MVGTKARAEAEGGMGGDGRRSGLGAFVHHLSNYRMFGGLDRWWGSGGKR